MPVDVTRSPDDFTRPYRLPYQLGIYLGVNAVPDAFAVIDGPDCLFRKAEWVHGKHDTMSTLLDVLGRHRIVSTLVNAEAVIKDRGEMVSTRIRQVAKVPGARAVMVCAMPHVMIIGTQYDRILRALEDEVPMELIELPSLSLQGDWIDGYVEVLTALARHVEVSRGTPDPRRIGIVGNLFDRNEADHVANVEELRRMFGAIGLDVASVWLSGTKFDALGDIGDAGTLVAFPLGRKAAHVIASRTGAKVVEVDAPFGPTRTRRMLRAVAAATGHLDAVEPFVERELRTIAPRLEWIVPHLFFGKRAVFAGAPDLLGGAYQIATELGMEVPFMASSTASSAWAEGLDAEFEDMPPILFAPTERRLSEQWAKALRDGPIDVLISDSHFTDMLQGSAPVVELGFPSHYEHALFERPHLGFRGWLCVVDRMARAMGCLASVRRRSEERDPRTRDLAIGARAPSPAPHEIDAED